MRGAVDRWFGAPATEQAVVSPNGDAIAYRETGRSNGLGVYELTSGETRWLGTDAELGPIVDHIAWSWDDERVLYHQSVTDEGATLWSVDRDGEQDAVICEAGSVLLADVGHSGLLWLDRSRWELHYTGRDGDTNAVRTDETVEVYGASFDPTGTLIAYTGVDADGTGVFLTDLAGDEHTRLRNEHAMGVRDWSDVGILVELDTMAIDRPNIGVIEPVPAVGTDAPSIEANAVGSTEYIEHPLQLHQDGRILAEQRGHDATLRPIVYTPDGDCQPIPLPAGVADVAGEGYGAVLADDRIVVRTETPSRPREAWTAKVEPPGTAEPLLPTDVELRGQGARHVRIDGGDGPIGVIIFEPSGDGPHPVVIRVPERPVSQCWQSFRPLDQVMLECGMGVAWVNQRGATAYLGGNGGLTGAFGAGDQDDIQRAAAWVSARSWVDADRLAIAGRAYGGYSTVLQLAHAPELYAAGVAWDPIGDLEAYVEGDTAGARAVRAWLAEVPPTDWQHRNPVRVSGAIQAPIALMQSVDDPPVPADHTERIRAALARTGSPPTWWEVTDVRTGAARMVQWLSAVLDLE